MSWQERIYQRYVWHSIGENPWPPAEIVPCPSDQHLIPPDRVLGPLYPQEEA